MKSLIILISLAVLVNASYVDAQRLYQESRYIDSMAELKKSTSEFANPELHILWAKNAKKLGDINAQMSAYERVLMLDSDNIEARVELLKIYNATSRDELANQMIKELEKFTLTKEQEILVRSSKKVDYGSLKATLLSMLGYDTNLNASADSDALNSYYSITDGSSPKATIFSKLGANFLYKYDLSKRDGYYIEINGALNYQNNITDHYFDMLIKTFGFGAGYKTSKYKLYIPIGYDSIRYLQSDLLSQLRVNPTLNHYLNNSTVLNTNLKYSSRDYTSKYIAMGDNSYAFGIGVNYTFNKNYIYLNSSYESFSSTQKLHYSFLDKSVATLSLGASYKLVKLFVAKLDYTYKISNYNDNNLKGQKREDKYSKPD